jgi:hypothetical protein
MTFLFTIYDIDILPIFSFALTVFHDINQSYI